MCCVCGTGGKSSSTFNVYDFDVRGANLAMPSAQTIQAVQVAVIRAPLVRPSVNTSNGTLCSFLVALRCFASRFQMTGTIICNNRCTQTLFPSVGKRDFSPPRIQIGRLCAGMGRAATMIRSHTYRCRHSMFVRPVQGGAAAFLTPL